jgi:hypothetical protein
LVNAPNNIAYFELVKMLNDNRSLYMTLKSEKNYFIVPGFGKILAGKRPHPNIGICIEI